MSLLRTALRLEVALRFAPALLPSLQPGPCLSPHQVPITLPAGMIPKLRTAIAAVNGGAGSVVIMDGRVPHCALVHLFGEGAIGTSVSAA